MSKYLVVAHQTATSQALRDKLREIASEDEGASFVLLVPATPVNHLLTRTEGEAISEASRTAEQAREQLQKDGLKVEEAIVGDASPMLAIGDAMRDHRQFDAIVVSTFPPGISRWLRLDVHAQARRKFQLPVHSVIAEKAPVGAH
jgi:nucleotide-binding universal stress UspA family protein